MQRILKWWQDRKFMTLLVTIMLLMVVYPLMRDTPVERLIFYLLRTFVILVCFWTVYSNIRFRILALIFGFPVFAGFWLGYFFSETYLPSLAIVFHLLGACFFLLTIISILRTVYQQETISADGIFGALCGYLLIGLCVSQIFSVIDLITPESFQMSGKPLLGSPLDARHHFLLTYFSFITLSTVGFGDITPVSELARSIATLEAIIGQFYIAVLVAELIGKRVSQVLSEKSAKQNSS
jgi:voltage-gated potassium channel